MSGDRITLADLRRLHAHAIQNQVPLLSDSDGPFYLAFLPAGCPELVQAAFESGFCPMCVLPRTRWAPIALRVPA